MSGVRGLGQEGLWAQGSAGRCRATHWKAPLSAVLMRLARGSGSWAGRLLRSGPRETSVGVRGTGARECHQPTRGSPPSRSFPRAAVVRSRADVNCTLALQTSLVAGRAARLAPVEPGL